MRIPSLSRHALYPAFTTLLFFILSAFRLSAAADSAPPAPPEIVELPTLNVTDTRELPEPEKWRYTRVGQFEAISSAPERETRRLLRDFEMFRLALGIAWPMDLRPPPPSSIILCGRARDFAQFLPKDEKQSSENRASLTLNNQEQAFIILDLGTKTVSLDPATIEITPDAPIPTDFDVDHYKQLYREYVRYLFSQSVNRPPAWLEEGLCQIVMKMEFEKRLIIFGRLEDPNAISASQAAANFQNQAATEAGDVGTATATVEDLDFNAALKRRALLGFDDFFGVTRDAEVARNPLGNNAWAKQSYAFVHMCLYGRGGRFKPAFDKFTQRIAKEPATEAIFEECFGKPYKKFLTDLRGYINFTDYKYQEFRITGKETLETPLPEMRDATEGEYTRIKGDAFRAAGNTTAARDSLVAAYIRGERDPAFLSTLGQAELASGNTARAAKFLAASAPKATRPSTLLDLAQLRFDDAIARPVGNNGKLSDQQADEILGLLASARKLTPPLPQTYRLTARTWIVKQSPPAPNELSTLAQGLKFFPRDEALVYYTAALNLRLGNHEASLALVTYGEKISTSEVQRGQFVRLKAQIQADTKH